MLFAVLLRNAPAADPKACAGVSLFTLVESDKQQAVVKLGEAQHPVPRDRLLQRLLHLRIASWFEQHDELLSLLF